MTDPHNTEDLFNTAPDAPPTPRLEGTSAGGAFAAEAVGALPIGGVLRSAREAKGASIADCAHALHLPIKVLERLEAGDLGTAEHFVFLRGALKSYARHLGLPAGSCDAALRAVAPSEPPRLIAVARTSPTRWLLQRYGTAATYIVLTATIAVPLVLLGLRGGLHRPAAEIVSLDQPSASARAAPTGVTSQHAPVPLAVSPDAMPFRASVAPLAAIGFDDAGVPDLTSATAAPLPSTPAAGQHSLKITATGDCWFEITNADGNKIDSGMLHAGDVRTWRSNGLLHVTLGNAGSVSVTSDGQPLVLNSFERANVARFEVFAPQGAVGNG